MTTENNPASREVQLANRQYHLAVQMALSDFQYIEESLRFYIAVAYDLIRHQMKGKLPFHFNEPDLEKDALGRLIQKYAKFSDNTTLVAELKRLQRHRNQVAHRGLLLTLEEQRNCQFLDEQTRRLDELHKELKPHIQTLLNEVAALTGEAPVII